MMYLDPKELLTKRRIEKLAIENGTYSGRYPFSIPVIPAHFSMAITVQIWMAVDSYLL